MKKMIGLTVIIMVAAVAGGFAYLYAPLAEQNTPTAIPDGATGIVLQNNGNSWAHVVAAFEDVPKKDGTVGDIYADVWLKPSENGNPGTASIDLSKLTGYDDQALPEGSKIGFKTWTSLLRPTAGGTDDLKLSASGPSNSPTVTFKQSSLPVIKLPPGITDNKVTTSGDPAVGGQFLSGITGGIIDPDPAVILPGASAIATEQGFVSTSADGIGISITPTGTICLTVAGLPPIII